MFSHFYCLPYEHITQNHIIVIMFAHHEPRDLFMEFVHNTFLFLFGDDARRCSLIFYTV